MLVRMRELAVQSASGTYSDTDRAALDLEFDQLRLEITRIQEKTTWNNQALMDGGKTVSIQLGASSGQTMDAAFADWSVADENVYGTATTKETTSLAFNVADMISGDTLEIGGLKLTATGTIKQADVVAGFKKLADGATTGNTVANGTWSGTLTGFSSGDASGTTVVFTSTVGGNVTDLNVVATPSATPGTVVAPAATTTDGTGTAISAISIHDAAGAAAAIVTLDKAITGVTAEQAKYGAYLSRLQYASDNISNVSTNLDQSRSRIQDADYAVETTALARTQIIAQASTAMLAQANQVKQTVLALLQ